MYKTGCHLERGDVFIAHEIEVCSERMIRPFVIPTENFLVNNLN